MTFTFFSASSNHKPKHELVTCHDCQWLGDSRTCIYCDGDGVIDRSCDPTVNLANSNAITMLELIGIEFDYSGSIAPELISEIRRNIVRLLNVKALRTLGHGPTSPTEDEYIVTTLRRIDEVLIYCQTHNECFLWG